MTHCEGCSFPLLRGKCNLRCDETRIAAVKRYPLKLCAERQVSPRKGVKVKIGNGAARKQFKGFVFKMYFPLPEFSNCLSV